MARCSGFLVVLMVALAIFSSTNAKTCLLVATIDSAASPYTAEGNITLPIPGVMKPLKMSATGKVFLKLPSGSDAESPCPTITAENAKEVLGDAMLYQPSNDLGISFKPASFKSKVLQDDGTPFADFNLNNFSIALDGNEPIGADAVKVGKGTAAEAKSAQVSVCTEDIMTGGVLNLTSQLTGPRTANLRSVATNITAMVGASVSADGKTVVLALDEMKTVFDINPEDTPGVEYTTASYDILGSIRATAKLGDKAAFLVLDDDVPSWKSLPRMDGQPVVEGGTEKGEPLLVKGNGGGCKVTRTASGSSSSAVAASDKPATDTGASTAEAPAASSSPAPASSTKSSAGSAALTSAAALVAAAAFVAL